MNLAMSPESWALLMFGGLALMLALRFHIGAAMLIVSVVGAILLYGSAGLSMSAVAAFSSVGTFTLTAIPLFILIGELLFRSNLAFEALLAIDRAFRRLTGRVAMLAVGGGSVLGVLSGSALASTSVLGGTLIPEMLRRGYDRRLAAGSVLGAGGLSMVLPPSAVVIVWGATAGVPVGPLLIAGIIPGLLMAVGYATVVLAWANLFGGAEKSRRVSRRAREADAVQVPASTAVSASLTSTGADSLAAPAGAGVATPDPDASAAAPSTTPSAEVGTGRAFLSLGVVLVVAAVTLGMILTGMATPSESAAVGLFLVLAACVLMRRLSRQVAVVALRHTVMSTGMIFFLIMAANIYSRVVAGSGIVRSFVDVITSISANTYVLIAIMLFIVIVLGLFLEAMAICLLTIPLFMPIVTMHGIDPIWFGMLMIICIQIGTVTPPLGMSLFVMRRYMPSDMPLGQIYRAAVPFVVSDLLVVTLLVAAPVLVLWLPGLMS